MTRFELVQPRSVAEAIAALDAEDPSVRPISGGTALMLMMKQKLFQPSRLVSLGGLAAELGGVRLDGEGNLHIGAMARLSELEKEPLIAKAAPVVAQALKGLANVRVRNQATIGGHVSHGDPHMDLPPILLAMGGRAQVTGPDGSRWVDLADLWVGYYETSLQRNELVTEVLLPAQAPGTQGAYVKFTSISADDWPALGVTALLRQENGRLADVKLVVSAIMDRPVRLTAVEALLTGERLTESLLETAGNEAAAAVRPLADLRGSVAYKREMVRVVLKDALQQAMQATPHRGV